MSNLAKSQPQWTQFLAKELVGGWIAPARALREWRDQFLRSRTQVWMIGDRKSATPHITALTIAGVDYGTNTNTEGRLYVRFVTNSANWDVNFYTATGASGLVAHVTNLAASGTAALVADNSSGLSGSITLGATIAADASDLHQVLLNVDFPARAVKIWTGADENDQFSRVAYAATCAAVAGRIQSAIGDVKSGFIKFALGDSAGGNPIGRGADFIAAQPTSLSTDQAVTDQGSGNVSRLRTGFFPLLSQDMTDEGTGGEQDIVRRVIAGGAGVFDGGNSGKGTVASHTPLEKTPIALWTFNCIRGADTGDLGKEQFSGTAVVTDGSGEPSIRLDGLIVERDWSGPRGIGSIRLRRTYAKTGDGSNLNLAAVTTSIFSGENNSNTAVGVLNWLVEANGSNWDISFYKSASLIPSQLVAKATNVATGAALNAVQQNASGLTITWTVGSAPVASTTGTISCQPFLVQNGQNKPDSFTISTSLTGTAGLIQELLGELFDAQLNSDTSGSESIPDNWAKQGTFAPYLLQDN